MARGLTPPRWLRRVGRSRHDQGSDPATSKASTVAATR